MQSTYKSFYRGQRIVQTEEQFTKGMYYGTAPLSEGFVKTLVNFNLKDSGSRLVPRPGIIVKEQYAYNASTKLYSEDEDIYLTDVLDWYFPSTKQMRKVAVMRTYNTKHNLTFNNNKALAITHLKLLELKDNKLTLLSETENGAHVSSIMPSEAMCHNLKLKDPRYQAKPVATKGYNNYYYALSPDAGIIQFKPSDEAEAVVKETLTPKALTPSQATNGYNMLCASPYDFQCDNNNGEVVDLTGILPYDPNNSSNVKMNAKIGDPLILKVFYNAMPRRNCYFELEWSKPNSGSWNQIHRGGLTIPEDLKPLEFKLNALPDNYIYIRASVYSYSNNGDVNEYPDSVITCTYDVEAYTEMCKDMTNYNLNNCTGMTYWQHRLVLWGAQEDKTMLFLSDIEDPTYFPYPNNADQFDEPIQYVTPYLNKLLIFTTSKIYMLTLGADGVSWTKALIQSNLHINFYDAQCVQVVKTMVMFKSGDLYFMIVPKANSGTGLTIAPISANISDFLKNFKKSVAEILKDVYNYSSNWELLHYYNFLDYEDIHNVYMLQLDDGRKINFELLYNSNARYWRIHISECFGPDVPTSADATKTGQLAYTTTSTTRDIILNLAEYDEDYIKDDNRNSSHTIIYNNVQFLNTGYREHNSNNKKRYRELQFEVNNIASNVLKFRTEFYLDGIKRALTTSDERLNPDDEASESTVILKTLESDIGFGDASSTVLDFWTLGKSAFPIDHIWKIRVPVSGKGYTPQIKILSDNQVKFELLNLSWVYRNMYTR